LKEVQKQSIVQYTKKDKISILELGMMVEKGDDEKF
jgi:hypothetical protein